MFGLEIIRINTVLLALAGGAVGVVAVLLTYWMIWVPRTDPEAEVHPPTTWDTLKQVPWIIWLTIATIVAYSILHLIQCARFAPNW